MPYTPQEIAQLKRGKTPEQQKVIDYFVGGSGGGCGCLSFIPGLFSMSRAARMCTTHGRAMCTTKMLVSRC